MAVWRGWRDELFCLRLGVASFFCRLWGCICIWVWVSFWFDGLDRLLFFFPLQGRKVVLCNRLESLCLEFNMFREKIPRACLFLSRIFAIDVHPIILSDQAIVEAVEESKEKKDDGHAM